MPLTLPLAGATATRLDNWLAKMYTLQASAGSEALKQKSQQSPLDHLLSTKLLRRSKKFARVPSHVITVPYRMHLQLRLYHVILSIQMWNWMSGQYIYIYTKPLTDRSESSQPAGQTFRIQKHLRLESPTFMDIDIAALITGVAITHSSADTWQAALVLVLWPIWTKFALFGNKSIASDYEVSVQIGQHASRVQGWENSKSIRFWKLKWNVAKHVFFPQVLAMGCQVKTFCLIFSPKHSKLQPELPCPCCFWRSIKL